MNKNQIIVAAFYKFVALDDCRKIQSELLRLCEDNSIKGTILLSIEGVNATVSGNRIAIDQVLAYLQKDARFKNLEYKEALFDKDPFYRMKVKIKKEIVTLGVPGTNPTSKSGQYVNARDWNHLISDPEVLVVDVRNEYESEIGSFRHAELPNTKSFRDFPAYVKANIDPEKQKKVAMFCTGGIRCEKASAYLLEQGFKEVFQLHGGILRYLEEVDEEDSLWEGDCFVFDGRVAVNQSLEKGEYELCYSCRRPVSEDDRKSEYYEEGLSCHRCFQSLSPEKRARLKERQKQVYLAEKRNQQHIGARQQK